LVSVVVAKNKATIKWHAPLVNGGSAVTGYNIYVGTKSGAEAKTPLNAVPITTLKTVITIAHPKVQYFFIIKAINAAGAGEGSIQLIYEEA